MSQENVDIIRSVLDQAPQRRALWKILDEGCPV